MAELKVNQLEIKSKLALLQIFNQKEDKKEDHGATFAFDEAARKSPVVVYQSPPTTSSQVMPDVEVEKGNSKHKQLLNTNLPEVANPPCKKFKVNDPCEINPLRPIDNDQLKHFMKWLDGKVENKKSINMKLADANMDWFLHLKTPRKWHGAG